VSDQLTYLYNLCWNLPEDEQKKAHAIIDGLRDAADEHQVRPPAHLAAAYSPSGVDRISDVFAELRNAVAKFPTWPTDPLHAMGVIHEEVGELAKAVLQAVYEPEKNPPGAVRKEAIQAAAMCIRFLWSLDIYFYAPSRQHIQEQR